MVTLYCDFLAISILMEFVHAKDNGQALFLDLGMAPCVSALLPNATGSPFSVNATPSTCSMEAHFRQCVGKQKKIL